MRSQLFSPRTLYAGITAALLMGTLQAQGLRAPGGGLPPGEGSSVSRALDATALPSVPGGSRTGRGANGARSADYIVAVVNSEPITNNEIRARMANVMQNIAAQNGQMPPQSLLAREVLERLIVEKVQLQEAKDTGIKADDYALDQVIHNLAVQNNMDKATFLARLKAEGLDEKQFRENVRRQLLMQRLREREVDNKVKVTEADLDRYLREQKRPGEKAAPSMAINLGHVLVAVRENASAAEVAEREARARQAAEAARTNPDFDAVVKEFSDAPLGRGGGAIGLRPLGEYPDIWSRAVADAPTGSVVGPVRSPAGFHILKVIDKSQAGMPAVITQNHARHILLRVGDGMNEAQAAKRLEDYRRRVENGQASFESLAREYSQDPGSARNGGDLGWSSPGQFVPEFERALDAMRPGNISEPIVSQFGVHLIQLVERRQKALTPREQREMVRNIVRERKIESDYETWLKELRGQAYVEYREPPQ